MRTTSFAGMTCSIASAVEAVGDRWGFLVLRDVMLGLSRYEELRRSTGEIVAPEDTSLEAGPGADEVMRWRLAVRAAR